MMFLILLFLLFPLPVFAQSNVSITSEPEEIIMGPVNDYIDSPFLTIPTTSGIRAFSANGTSYSFSGPEINSLQIENKVLEKGNPGNFDECGAWLQSIYKLNEEHWLGWYHAEEKCDYSVGKTHKSVAFAESFDSGRSWTKTNYPNNQVLVSDVPFNDTDQDDVGDMHVIAHDDYFYMFYLADWKIYVAKSKISDQGRPGTWIKNPITLSNFSSGSSYVTFNQYLNSYISIATYGRWGFYFRKSNGQDLLSWQEDSNQIVPQISHNLDLRVDNWVVDRSQSLDVYGYPSIIGLDGNSDVTGQSFYLYYMKVYPHENFTERYLLRRKITLGNNPYHKVALTTETSIDIPKSKASSPSLGYLVSHPYTGLVPVYHCKDSAQSNFITTQNPEQFSWEHCLNTNDTFVRKIGYLSPIQKDAFTKPLINPLDNQIVGYIVPKTFTGDLNNNSKVDIFDYNILVSKFGNPYTIYDYNLLIANFGKQMLN